MAKVVIEGKEYTVRKLIFDDYYSFSKILEKMQIDVSKFRKKVSAQDSKKFKDQEELYATYGTEILFDMINHFIANYHKAHKEVADWLGDLIGVDADQIRKMPVDAPVKIFKALAEENDLVNFFRSAV